MIFRAGDPAPAEPARRRHGGGTSWLSIASVLAVAFSAKALAQCAYEIAAIVDIPLCPPFEPVLYPMAINNNREVVGFYNECAIGEYRPFYWSMATGLVLPPLPAGYSSAQFIDINDRGQITGNRVVGGSGMGNEAILYEDGRWTGLGTIPGGNWSEGLAINNAGTIVGFCGDAVAGPGALACRWDDQALTDLSGLVGGTGSKALGISESGVVVGYARFGVAFSELGFSLDGTELSWFQPAPGLLNAKAVGVNDQGLAIVNCASPGKEQHWNQGFLVNGDSWQLIPPIAPGEGVSAVAINATGAVLGVNMAWDVSEVVVVVGGRVRKVQDMILGEQNYGVWLAFGMNDEGWIAAAAQIGQTFMVLVLKPVPPAPGELDGDCRVDATDLAILLGSWGPARGNADLDSDGMVDANDLQILVENWSSP